MKTIDSRDDVSLLVNTFYVKIRKDKLLGPIFNGSIPDDHWPLHLEKLTDFWETNLFGVVKFKGNPPAAHQRMDEKEGHTISQAHFGKWLQLWYETLDQLFEGERAEKAKAAARRMSTGLFLAIWHKRPE
ncbi:group III truncated hemoglobin [Cryomorpha ignava]|uniref:Group III truncated hemoglobin n=1 Tax=Cryomorpha ignava TaxID=101383 RepID=A0A7K3WKT4_9FLAO|nr:group III truncated hemoglobin [Cryomorpha ignava]NEN22257.1 group III truncated hemoglobin [Cryomorpha ignava]